MNQKQKQRRQERLRRDLAEWMNRMRAVVWDAYKSVEAIRDELANNPRGEVALLLADCRGEVKDLMWALGVADMHATGLALTCENPIPCPLAEAAR